MTPDAVEDTTESEATDQRDDSIDQPHLKILAGGERCEAKQRE